jgi:hypothetical protein
MIFYNFPREGAMKNRLQKREKKKRERYPPPQRVGNTHPTYLSFLLAFIPLLPLVVYILIYFYLHPLVFTKEEILK